MNRMCKSPVLFLVFNRPETTARVFAAIREAKPERLYVAADGPRADRPEERLKTEDVREIATAVDWTCEVKTLFRATNFGCRIAVSEAINWFFEHEEQGIILEDDCLPHPDFFPYCDVLLDSYAQDTRIGQINGCSFAVHINPESYAFTRYGTVWGWATWRRAWKFCDVDLKQWPRMRTDKYAKSVFPDRAERAHRRYLGDRLFRHEIDSWAYPWGLTRQYNHMLSITPCVNLVENIGFGADATHTTGGQFLFPKPTGFDFAWKHPDFVCVNHDYEKLFFSMFQLRLTFTGRLKSAVRAILPESLVERIKKILRRPH